MIEKVNPSHPDKIADRIAGAIVDLSYTKDKSPKVAVEVLIGHGICHIISESNIHHDYSEIETIVKRIGGLNLKVDYVEVPQDIDLAKNQKDDIRCGDNGIFKGVPLRKCDKKLSEIARTIYKKYPYDGKYILDKNKLIICQSNAKTSELEKLFPKAIINPLGYWTGGSSVDTGATNRKLGSDMALSITGGGLHGKDLSKADVSVNIYVFLKAQKLGKTVKLSCAIGDNTIDNLPYSQIVEIAKNFINECGGFEKLAEWGLF